MNEITFGSTDRIPLVERNITQARRDGLKKMVSAYQNVLYPKGNNGYVRVSIRKRLDERFEQKLHQMGFKVFQKFEKHNVPKTQIGDSGVSKLDVYIKDELIKRNYKQFGKQIAKRPRQFD